MGWRRRDQFATETLLLVTDVALVQAAWLSGTPDAQPTPYAPVAPYVPGLPVVVSAMSSRVAWGGRLPREALPGAHRR